MREEVGHRDAFASKNIHPFEHKSKHFHLKVNFRVRDDVFLDDSRTNTKRNCIRDNSLMS